MNLTKIVTSVLFSVTFAIPAMASSNWVNDFLHRYDPSATAASRPESATTPNVSQFLRTGEVPVSINDVINMMLDNNLDIRAAPLALEVDIEHSVISRFWLAFTRVEQPPFKTKGVGYLRSSNWGNNHRAEDFTSE